VALKFKSTVALHVQCQVALDVNGRVAQKIQRHSGTTCSCRVALDVYGTVAIKKNKGTMARLCTRIYVLSA
jgi:hypothetical protein